VIPFLLGESALRRQNWERAADQLQRCLELNPNFDNAMTGLARALAKLGRGRRGEKLARQGIAQQPAELQGLVSVGAARCGERSGSGAVFVPEGDCRPANFSPGQLQLGLALFQRKDYAAAATHLEKAIALGLEDAHIHNFWGSATARQIECQRPSASISVLLNSTRSWLKAPQPGIRLPARREKQPGACRVRNRLQA